MTRRGGRAVVADPGRPTRRLFQSILEQVPCMHPTSPCVHAAVPEHPHPSLPEQAGLRADFRSMAATSPDSRSLLLLHVSGERPVSDFVAHADIEG